MSKVFIINDMNHEFEKAKKHGELHYVTKGKVPIFKTDVIRTMLKEGLTGFNIEKDFLLLSGSSILCIIASLIVTKQDVPIKTLVFDAKEQDYVVRHISA